MALRKQLATPYTIDFTVTHLKVNSIAIDDENQLVHLGHTLLASDDTVIQADRLETLSGQDYSDYNARKNALGDTLSARNASFQAALEYLPGAGTVSGDTKTLNTPYTVNGTCNMLKIESFAYNTDDGVVLIGYTKMKYPDTILMSHLPWVLTGQEYQEFLNQMDANEATMTVTAAEVTTCLEWLPDAGAVVDV